ncbi:MAG: glycoside hydrolase family 2, partial [Prevotella sp.]|nr:glycoside hydrolase family 2 [Prevotella sp.]
GRLKVENHYDFTRLKACRMDYRWLAMPAPFDKSGERELGKGTLAPPDLAPGETGNMDIPKKPSGADVLEVKATDPHGMEIFTWRFRPDEKASPSPTPAATATATEQGTQYEVTASGRTYVFSKEDGRLKGVRVSGKNISLTNGPRFVASRRSDRSFDQFYNHDDKEAFSKKTEYTLYDDQGAFDGFTLSGNVLSATYRHGSLEEVRWTFLDSGVEMEARYNFTGVVDLMGVCFDYPEEQVKWKRWVGDGPYRVWQNRMEGPQYGYWQNDYNDPVPGETFEYPEFKGYFSNVAWMLLGTSEGSIGIQPLTDSHVGVYQPRDGRDHILYTLPNTGLALLKVIPAVRNKVNTTDLNGPSAQPFWAQGKDTIKAIITFEP